MKKKIIFYSCILLFSAACFWYFNSMRSQSGYDTSDQGISATKGQFVPEQTTDYIYTTVETESNFYYLTAIVGALLILAIIFFFRKRAKKIKNEK